MEKDHKWGWTNECNNAFLKCKDMLTCEAVFDNTKPIKLACDASSYGLGAVLSHVCDDGEHSIAFVSRTLTKEIIVKLKRKHWDWSLALKNSTNIYLGDPLHC